MVAIWYYALKEPNDWWRVNPVLFARSFRTPGLITLLPFPDSRLCSSLFGLSIINGPGCPMINGTVAALPSFFLSASECMLLVVSSSRGTGSYCEEGSRHPPPPRRKHDKHN
jgi:hypothetical protein